ncbi:hypothetical protein JXI42_02835 [bacterium]|nr:hypothetical protein [bacterium]
MTKADNNLEHPLHLKKLILTVILLFISYWVIFFGIVTIVVKLITIINTIRESNLVFHFRDIVVLVVLIGFTVLGFFIKSKHKWAIYSAIGVGFVTGVYWILLSSCENIIHQLPYLVEETLYKLLYVVNPFIIPLLILALVLMYSSRNDTIDS